MRLMVAIRLGLVRLRYGEDLYTEEVRCWLARPELYEDPVVGDARVDRGAGFTLRLWLLMTGLMPGLFIFGEVGFSCTSSM